ncbi:hypothetical protein C0989_006915, partial [Termitomyces sp. Mn162]
LGPGFETHVQVPSGVEEEGGDLGGCMNVVVVLELSIREEFVPIILVLVAKEVEVLLQLLLYVFGLAVGLQVVGSGGVELHAEDVSVGEAVELPDISQVQVYAAHGGASGVSWNEVHSLAIQVYHYHDGVVTMSVREFYDEVHRGNIPLLCGNG